MTDLQFKTVSDLTECRALWEKFSPHRTIFQEWDWRYAHYRFFNFPVKFIVGLDANQPIGILPLQYETEEKFWEFFGGQDMEDNGVWVKPGYEKYARKFLEVVSPIWLDYLLGEDEFIASLKVDCYGYKLEMKDYTGIADFIDMHLIGKVRRNIRYAWRNIEALSPKITRGNWDDLELLFELNEKVFGQESSFFNEHEKEIFHDLIKLPYQWDILTLEVKNQKVAVILLAVYKETCYFLAVGYDRSFHKDLGVYVNLLDIEEAVRLKVKTADFGYHDCGWKERWNFERIPYHQYWAGLEPDI